ncbi:MAG: hypothetical protein SOI26_10765 [Coriobacteriales bacterium]|jgi:K+/H+ antiporter YhaU regulatory subunit KhtT
MRRRNEKGRFQYWFDNLMSKGTASLIGVLLAFSLTFVVVTGVVGAAIGGSDGEDSSFLSNIWASLNHTLDAGTLAGDTGSVAFIALMAVVTVFGLFVTSMLIGIISNGISDKIESLRKGRSVVIEGGHTIILGFNQTTISIVRELVVANQNQQRACVVVMDERDKTEMEEAIHQAVGRTGHTRVICRSGRVDDPSDISICSPGTCKSIIVNVDDDYLTTKAVLACAHLLSDSDGAGSGTSPFICAVARSHNSIAPMLIAGQGRAEVFYFESVIAKMMAQTLRRPGISEVFDELLSFNGNEIYIEPASEGLVDVTLDEVNRRLPLSTAIGIERDGEAMLNPGGGTTVRRGDSLILIAPDDGVSSAGDPAAIDEGAFAPVRRSGGKARRTVLILGSNALTSSVIREAGEYAAPGSRVIVAASQELIEETPALRDARPCSAAGGLSVELRPCDVYDSPTLASLMDERPENVLVLSDPRCSDDDADARVLMLLLQLYDIRRNADRAFSVTSELRDAENQKLAQVTGVTDFVISSNMTALMMAQVSEGREKRPVIEELLSSRGSEIYMKPARRYVLPGVACSFHTLKSSASRYGEVAIGCKRMKGDGSFSIEINPRGDDMVGLGEGDMVIVIAQDAR